jgi:hypothetical protein
MRGGARGYLEEDQMKAGYPRAGARRVRTFAATVSLACSKDSFS